MQLDIGTLKLNVELHLTTPAGGPIILGEGIIDAPMHVESTGEGATLTVDQDALRHEIAGVLMDAARQIEAGTT